MLHFIMLAQSKTNVCAGERRAFMPTKEQKRAVIKQLLIPVFLIIAALLYQPVRGLFQSQEKISPTRTEGSKLTVSYIDVGQGDATLI